MGLNAKRRRFVDEYVIDLNATQAAIRAGYSKKTATSVGSRLLTFVDVSAEIERKKAEIAAKSELSAEFVLDSLKRIAAKAEAAEQYQAASRCHELLGKRLALFTDKVEHQGEIRTVAVTINGIRKR